jgi:hypothetical protein
MFKSGDYVLAREDVEAHLQGPDFDDLKISEK